MDLRVASSSYGKQKLREDQGIDIISNMPDCILQHIYSFLSTKDVFRTSILSKRWEYLWTSLSNLDLEYKISWKIKNPARREILKNKFLEFVNRVLVLHDASVIKRLRLSLDHLPEKVSRLDLSISIALEHNVEELELRLRGGEQCELPRSLFTSSSLTSLKIDSRLTFNAPSCTCFLNLKKLVLSIITFADELSIQRLFSNCPVLVELELVWCDWKYIKNVTISVPSLRNLTITCDEDGRSLSGDRDGEYITDPHVKIVGANITHLEYSSHVDIEVEFVDLSSLKAASLDLQWHAGTVEKVATHAFRLFSWISDVEHLTLSTCTIECLSRMEASLDHLPTFYSLKRLTVVEQFFRGCAVFLLKFLQKMPKLEYFELNNKGLQDLYAWTDDQVSLRDKIMRQIAPSCFNSSLRTFAVKEFEGDLRERLMIEYVLKNVTVLEYLCISCSKHLEKETLSKFKDCLEEIPRGSESCIIKISS